MAWLRVTLDEFSKHEVRHGGNLDETWNGYSPGYAASTLGVSRWAVHKAVERGTLEGIRVEHDNGTLAMLLIPERALDHYREHHLDWVGLRKQA